MPILIELMASNQQILANPNALPEGWNAIPHGQASAAFGGDWLQEQKNKSPPHAKAMPAECM